MTPNGADASFSYLRNVSNALGTPASLPTPPDRFWGDPASTRHTFDNFSDFRFSHFLHGFSFKFAQMAPFGFRRRPYQSGGHPDRSIHPATIIPPEVRILEISHFPEPGKIQEISKKESHHNIPLSHFHVTSRHFRQCFFSFSPRLNECLH